MDSFIQEEAWKELLSKLDRLPHALLLHGPQGVGKLALAERFAALLLCERGGKDGRPCGACDGCRWFAAGSHPDVRFVEPEAIARQAPEAEEGEDAEEEPTARGRKRKPSTEIRVDEIRALAGFVNLGSHRGGRRVAIVHPAEDMNASAANALLKSLEEPPPGAMFILVSHRPARLLPTIRSRCVHVAVRVPDAVAARNWLEAQGVRDAARWLAFAGGSPRRALEYASGEQGEAIERILRALASGRDAAADAVSERAELELLAEILQKIALDRAFAALGGRAKYSAAGAGARPDEAREWLAYARAMGRNRALARHPLNPKLFAAEMLGGMPGAERGG
jgi:DNA polymerase-3 subunit delta'